MTKLSDILALGFSDKQLLRHMPPRLSEIADIIGVQKAIVFGLKYGGGLFFIPERLDGPSPADIVELIGYEDAEKLCHFLSKVYLVRIEVPSCFSGSVYRKLQGVKLLMEGKSYREVALEVGAARSTVKRWYSDFVRPAR